MNTKDTQPSNASAPRADAGMTRRELVKVGTTSLLGATVPALLASHADAATRGKSGKQQRDVSVILLWMAGGPSHLDTFDPKPHAEAGIKGPFGAIPTNVSGVLFTEHLPGLAGQMDKMALLRSVSHGDGAHERATHYLLTGHPALPRLQLPSYGAVIAREKGTRNDLPAHVTLPGGMDPKDAPMADKQMRQAFALGREKAPMHEAYGSSRFGQSCLLARRLVEHGVRCVTVTQHGWDTHENNFSQLRQHLLPDLDRGMSALLRDLEQRGLLETTLVVWMGEFGRTPMINTNTGPGRDHWPQAMSVVMAGGGIQGGQVVGATDARGMEPVERPLRPEDIAATLYHVVGIDPRLPHVLPTGSALPLANAGHVIQELI